MTPYQIKLAARMWAFKHCTADIADNMPSLADTRGAREAIVWKHMDAIRAEAATMTGKAA